MFIKFRKIKKARFLQFRSFVWYHAYSVCHWLASVAMTFLIKYSLISLIHSQSKFIYYGKLTLYHRRHFDYCVAYRFYRVWSRRNYTRPPGHCDYCHPIKGYSGKGSLAGYFPHATNIASFFNCLKDLVGIPFLPINFKVHSWQTSSLAGMHLFLIWRPLNISVIRMNTHAFNKPVFNPPRQDAGL